MKINKKIKFINCKFNNFVYVEDVFKIINHFIEKKIFIDNKFNVSCSNVTSSEKVLKIMKKHLNSNSKIVKQKKTLNTYTISNKKLSKYFKTSTVEDTISKFLKDYES